MVIMNEQSHTLVSMGTEQAGAAIKRRRTALGLSVKALAERAGVDRGRLAAIEDGASARSSTIGALETALNEIEHETSGPYDDATGGLVTFRLSGNFGVDVVVQGPVEHISELEANVERLIRNMRTNGDSGA